MMEKDRRKNENDGKKELKVETMTNEATVEEKKDD